MLSAWKDLAIWQEPSVTKFLTQARRAANLDRLTPEQHKYLVALHRAYNEHRYPHKLLQNAGRALNYQGTVQTASGPVVCKRHQRKQQSQGVHLQRRPSKNKPPRGGRPTVDKDHRRAVAAQTALIVDKVRNLVRESHDAKLTRQKVRRLWQGRPTQAMQKALDQL